MKAKPVIALLLGLLAVGAAVAAHRLWQTRDQREMMLAGLPAVPDAERWPSGFHNELIAKTAAVKNAVVPLSALERLAMLYVANGFAAEGRQALTALERLQPTEPRWVYWEALARNAVDDGSGYERALQRTVALDRDYAPAWIRLGVHRREAGAFTEAADAFAHAMEADPGNLCAQFEAVALQARAGSRGDPRPKLVALVAEHPELREPHALLHDVYLAAVEKELAAEQSRLERRADRDVPRVDRWADELDTALAAPERIGRAARERVRQRRFDEAEALLKHGLELSPHDTILFEDLAVLYTAEDKSAEARITLQTALAKCAPDPELPARLAAALRVERKAAEAAEVARSALRTWPGDAALQAQVGFALREAGETEAAITALREALRRNPNQPEAEYALALCLLATRDRAGARQAVERSLALRPEDPAALVMYGGMVVESGDLAEAERVVATLHALRPDEPGYRLLSGGLQMIRGEARENAGELDVAAQLYRAGLATAPDFPPLLRKAGLLATRRSQFPEAVDLFERYLRYEKRDTEIYLALGSALVEMGREPEGRHIYELGLSVAEKAGDAPRVTEFRTRLDH